MQGDTLEAFEDFEDPRSRSCSHVHSELLLVALCGITSGAQSWGEVMDWGRIKIDGLGRFFPFANGVASHDPLSRVFNLPDAAALASGRLFI